ncbi:hypothetical protein MVEG_10977 [Podila verticillata NRRL 6337]|uniref:Uncharacterized protein n=1 Tax=Podila verticillata NRRL 6337 TaxID=1069443 RepID=A0A086TLW2_9FUNG|nr:hypothetical protein MVEG_10977 [Podila verticillata NRRL 6337]
MTMEVDIVKGLSLGKIDVDKDPILELTCGHAFTLTTLDGMMDMKRYYEQELDPATGRTKFTAKLPLLNDEVNQGAQLGMHLKKYQIAQENAMANIKDKFDITGNQIKMGHKDFVLVFSAPRPPASINPPLPEMRHLGKFALESNGTSHFRLRRFPSVFGGRG